MSNMTEEQQDIECSEEQQMDTNITEEAEETVTTEEAEETVTPSEEAEETVTPEEAEETVTPSEEAEETTPSHPYQDQLSQFRPRTWQLEEKEPHMYSSLDDTQFTLVDSQPLLAGMMVKLKEVRELGIAVEHYYRSFHGTVCLLQISTRTEDFLIDPLVIKEDLHVLNQVCTDSNILKVMHVRYRDIKWLQKDFGIYVINMFDTQKAARALKEEGSSAQEASAHGALLPMLLKKYCNIVVNKEHERTDWRVRPLPGDMVKYAREEAHFLLYLHDVFRNSLLKKKALVAVYKACTDACGHIWQPDKPLRPDSYMACYKRGMEKIKKGKKKEKKGNKLNVRQLECFRLLYEWRYHISKENDESTGYMLPNRAMIKIAKALPKEAEGVVACCNPVPPYVEQHLEDVHKLVLQAIKNVPEVPTEPVVEKPQFPAIKGSNKKKSNKYPTRRELFLLKHSTCLSCGHLLGHLGHPASDCGNQNNGERFGGGMRPPLRGGATWNGGRGAPFGAYPPPRGPWTRGGPGFRGRGPRRMGTVHMYHPYGHPPPHHPLRGDMYDGMDSYDAGPYNGRFNPYHQHPRFNAGGW